MANIGQATFMGGQVNIECDGSWTCCQREQAKAKVDGYNNEINAPDLPGPLQISPSVVALGKAKKNAQQRAWNRFRKAMADAKPEDRAEVAKQHSTSDCVAEELAEKWNNGKTSSQDLGVQMDHKIECKFGGPANVDNLLALDSTINNFFGVNVSQVTGDQMLAAGQTEVESVQMVCPADENCDKDYST